MAWKFRIDKIKTVDVQYDWLASITSIDLVKKMLVSCSRPSYVKWRPVNIGSCFEEIVLLLHNLNVVLWTPHESMKGSMMPDCCDFS